MEQLVINIISNIFGPYAGPFWAVAGGVVTAVATKLTGHRKDKRDDFVAITDALYKQINLIAIRIDQTEEELNSSKEETRKCEERYTELVDRYNELTKNYKHVIETNEELSREMDTLRQKLQAHISLTQLVVNEQRPTDSRSNSFII